MKLSYSFLLLAVSFFFFAACNKSQQGKDEVLIYFLEGERTETEVKLRWQATGCDLVYECPVLAPDRFEIQMSKGNMENFVSLETVSATDSTFTVPNLEKGVSYYFKLIARNGKKKTSYANIICIIPDNNPIIRKVLADRITDFIDVSWSSDQNIVSYTARLDEQGNPLNEGANYSVFVESLNGGLTFVEENARSPRLSPDGQTLVYTSENNLPRFRSDIILYDINSRTKTRLVSNMGSAYLPNWSADGEWVSFLVNDAERHELFIYKIHKSGGQALKVSENIGAILYSGSGINNMSWSKDNTTIMFDMPSDRNGRQSIFSIPSNGGEISLLEESSLWNNYAPAVSPDGNYLAFISQRSSVSDIWIKNLKTNELKQLTGKAGLFIPFFRSLNWSADSKRIMFIGYEALNYSLFEVALP